MTSTEQAQYEKALTRAIHEDIHVVGHGTIKATGQHFVSVTSSADDGCYTTFMG